MELHVGLDASLKHTSICVVDGIGRLVVEGVVASNPGEIAAFLMSEASAPVRVGLEMGPTATWLWHELHTLGVPVICIDAHHVKAALSMQINKNDRNDALGLARIMQSGWYKEVRVKNLDSHRVRALLNSRALLVKIKRDIENQIRGLFKNLGILIGKARGKAFTLRIEELISDRPVLAVAIGPLLVARETVGKEIVAFDRHLLNDISRCLAERGASVEEMETQIRGAPMGGGILFYAQARVRVPPSLSEEELRQALEALAGALIVDITPREEVLSHFSPFDGGARSDRP